MSTVIKVENLSKQYRLGQVGTGTISHDVNRWWHKIRGKEDPYLKIGESNDRTVKGDSDYVWALKDINFEVKQGEVLGIIGRNGAGKSTLLKILSRTTAPTTGSVKIKGRVASLLEVGTGFHPELSGRDNIFLNGAILGMTKREIQSKFDEIVDFAGVERYIDTPVKRYSSGMYVRLAFAVAAHLEPEILIVDEVLAVGDAEFQKKCLGKMKDVSVNQGRTILFVSHNLGAIAQLCTKTILLSKGNLIKYNSTNKVVDDYLKKSINQIMEYINSSTQKEIGILLIKTVNELNAVSSDFTHLQPINIVVTIKINTWVNDSELRLVVRDLNGKAIFTSDYLLEKINIKSGEVVLKCKLPSEFLRPGIYNITIATFIPHKRIIEAIEDVISVSIIDGGSKYSVGETTDYGYVFFNTEWEVQEISK